MSAPRLDCDVAIIGAGPVGLTLANLLARRGVSVAVLEKQAEPYDLPRAIHFDGEIMRVFQAAGLAAEVAPLTLVGKGMLFKNAAGRVLIDWSRAQEVGPQGWYESYRFHQPGLEKALAGGLARFGHADLRRGVAVSGLAQNDDQVTLTLDDGGRLTAGYVVGCDGASSWLRHALAIDLTDLGFREPWAVVDIELTRPRPDLGDHSVQYCDPDAPATYVRGIGGWRRWEWRRSEQDAPLDDAAVWRRLGKWITPNDGRLARSAVYEFRSAIAARWRVGRCFLAGDAAHQMPPFMGQGMCAGVRDAANLTWKLAMALRGGPDVLDSYEPERAPHVRAFIDKTMQLGRLINQTAAGEAPSGQMSSVWPNLGPGLAAGEQSGALAPQPVMSGQHCDDLAAGGFYVLARLPCKAPVPVFAAAEDWLDQNGLFAALIRPDGYVLEGAPDAGSLGRALHRWSTMLT